MSKDVIERLKEEYGKELDAFYKKDSSHGWSHVEDVAKNALEINRKMILNLNEEYLVLAALFHDIYSDTDRKNHHTLAADWFARFMVKQYKYDAIDILEMSLAIKEHRASYNGEYSSLLSEVLAAADRGAPDLNSLIIRSSKYYLEKEPNRDLKTVAENVYKHMLEKYSRTGYMKYNAIYSSFYGEEIYNMYAAIDDLNIDKVFNILIENLKEQEEENLNKTNRGFSIFRFKDSYGNMCSIQESSSASEPKIWFGIDNAKITTKDGFPVDSENMTTFSRMHLNQEQVKKLLPILQKFADTGNF